MSITHTAASGHPFATQTHNYTCDLIDRLLTASAATPANDTCGHDNLDNATTYNLSAWRPRTKRHSRNALFH
jgi:hypothetical protein